jgi:pimeloyl-ACP methyl ester carboxylesterase
MFVFFLLKVNGKAYPIKSCHIERESSGGWLSTTNFTTTGVFATKRGGRDERDRRGTERGACSSGLFYQHCSKIESEEYDLLMSGKWRLYRNWLIAALVWVSFAFALVMIVRSLVHLVWAVPLYFVGLQILQDFRLTHPRTPGPMPICIIRAVMLPSTPCTTYGEGRDMYRHLTPGDFGLAYRQVEFSSRDGLRLSGWYVPGSNRAAVIMMHGGGTQGIDLGQHAAALARHGYGVLLFDLRAHGRSEGHTCTYGWRETNDLLGAIDYVQGRDDVDAGRIGVFGFSLGGQIALRTAAQTDTIRAVATEGPARASAADRIAQPATPGRWLLALFRRFSYALLSLLNGEKVPPGVLSIVGDIAPRPILLISTGEGREQAWVRTLHQAAAEPKSLWEIPAARHGEGYALHPEMYTPKLVTFFDAALLDGRAVEAGEAARSRQVGMPHCRAR